MVDQWVTCLVVRLVGRLDGMTVARLGQKLAVWLAALTVELLVAK
jgi:hypothetical protein